MKKIAGCFPCERCWFEPDFTRRSKRSEIKKSTPKGENEKITDTDQQQDILQLLLGRKKNKNKISKTNKIIIEKVPIGKHTSSEGKNLFFL